MAIRPVSAYGMSGRPVESSEDERVKILTGSVKRTLEQIRTRRPPGSFPRGVASAFDLAIATVERELLITIERLAKEGQHSIDMIEKHMDRGIRALDRIFQNFADQSETYHSKKAEISKAMEEFEKKLDSSDPLDQPISIDNFTDPLSAIGSVVESCVTNLARGIDAAFDEINKAINEEMSEEQR